MINTNNSSILPTKFNLTDSDIEKYRRKFITVEMARNEGRRRVSNYEAGQMLNPHNTNDFNRRYKDCSGLVYVYRTFFLAEDPKRPRQYRVRRDNPEKVEKHGKMSEKAKYLSASGAENMFYVPQGVKIEWLNNTLMPIVFFEGEDKALAAARVASEDYTLDRWHFTPIGLAGVWNFRTKRTKKGAYEEKIEYRGLLIDFDYIEWNERKTTILFDANVHTINHVKNARRELGSELQALAACVYFADLPEKYAGGKDGVNGFDDYLALIAKETGSDELAIKAGLELINSARPAEEKKVKENQAMQILKFAENLKLFHTADRESYAVFEVDGHEETHRLNSKSFRNWFSFRLYKSERQLPQAQALRDAIGTLEGCALFECEERQVFVRMAYSNGQIYLDLCNESWRIVEISKNGWRLIESKDAPVRFYRTKAMLPLPTPKAGGSLQKLREFLNVNNDEYILILSWLVNCFRTEHPFPILIMSGEQGTAKSTNCRVLRRLIDPNKTDFRSAPRDERDLVIAASNAWLCAYDNISSVPHWLSDAFCRISTGGGFSTRTLYENTEETIFAAKRPILLNGIGEIANRGDLIDRAILVSLKPISKETRKTERQFWREFMEVENEIFSGLLDAVAIALRNIDDVHLQNAPRMADFAHWATAAEPALGFTKSTFINAFERNKNISNYIALEGSPLADAIQKYVAHKQIKESNKFLLFIGNLQEFLDVLEPFSDEVNKKVKSEYPKSPRGVRSKLERINPNLRAIGINVELLRRTEKGQLVKIENICFQRSEPSDGQDALQTKDLTPDFQPDGLKLDRQTGSQPSANRQSSNINNHIGLDIRPDVPDGSDGWRHNFSNEGQSPKKPVDEVI